MKDNDQKITTDNTECSLYLFTLNGVSTYVTKNKSTNAIKVAETISLKYQNNWHTYIENKNDGSVTITGRLKNSITSYDQILDTIRMEKIFLSDII